MSVCLFVCLSVCLCVCLSVQAITFEPLELGSSFSAYRYILTISRLSLSIKVTGSRSRSNENMTYFIKLLLLYAYIPLKLTYKVKVISRSRSLKCKGQIKGIQFQFFIYCKCFCDLCVMRMICLRLKGILVAFSISSFFSRNVVFYFFQNLTDAGSKPFTPDKSFKSNKKCQKKIVIPSCGVVYGALQ